MKKWWLEAVFPDGKQWSGWINTTAENKEDFPETIKGTFWTESKNNATNGLFELGDGNYAEENYVIANTLMARGWIDETKYVRGSREHIEAIEDSMKSETEWERHTFKIEDCLVLSKTYIVEF